MPSLGIRQQPAGVDISPQKKPYAGIKSMESRNSNIRTGLVIDNNCVYKGNAVLNAQRS
tara:strand:+ start:2591 stop:2767 length:177 start_codon:yes stop_codon:yes gene_type:complete